MRRRTPQTGVARGPGRWKDDRGSSSTDCYGSRVLARLPVGPASGVPAAGCSHILASCGRASASSTTSPRLSHPRPADADVVRGEAQRIALSNALGSHLVDTLYVLDEPSIGLHPRTSIGSWGCCANWRLPETRWSWWSTIRRDARRGLDGGAGPASGAAGGQLVYRAGGRGARAGTLTGQYLSAKTHRRAVARRPAVRWLDVKGARLHNLAGVDVRIPLAHSPQ